MTRKLDPPTSENLKIGAEAADWYLRLREPASDPKDPYFDPEVRDAAFMEWVTRSPVHLRLYLEAEETAHRLQCLQAARRVNIETLLEKMRPDKNAEVIPLFGYAAPSAPSKSRRRVAFGIAASIAILTTGGLLAWNASRAPEYVTGVGEQRTCKLEDGSVVVLNTDSRVRVDYSSTERHIELLRGEALFAVEHNAKRPFTVSTNQTRIRAVGTQFNVRRSRDDTDVIVVEGIVQITDASTGATPIRTDTKPVTSASAIATTAALQEIRLAAGEEAHVVSGQIQKKTDGDVARAVLWRQRRLSFSRTPLATVAAEFNRYNKTKISIENLPEGGLKLSGIFDADRPLALIRYIQRFDTLSVEQRGSDWFIRARVNASAKE